MSICAEKCWTPIPCLSCGSELPPRGRSVPIEWNLPQCCEVGRYGKENTRHLWSEHDDARHYVDPAGWGAHLIECDLCGGY